MNFDFGFLKTGGSLAERIEDLQEQMGGTSEDDSRVGWEEEVKSLREELTAAVEEIVESRLLEFEARLEPLKRAEKKLEEVESYLQGFKSNIDSYQERLDKMDESIVELLSLYDVVSSNVNPFVETGGGVEVSEKLESLSLQTERLEEELSRVKESLDARLEKRISELEGQSRAAVEQFKAGSIKSGSEVRDDGDVFEDDGFRRDATLSRIDLRRPEVSMLLLRWLEFLLERVGRNNLAEVLDYYVDIGWISDEVSVRMLSYAEGIECGGEKPGWKLLPADHAKSLYFIGRIVGRGVDRGLMARVDMELEKLEEREGGHQPGGSDSSSSSDNSKKHQH